MSDGQWPMSDWPKAILRVAHRPSSIADSLAWGLLLVASMVAPASAKGPTLDHLFPGGATRGSTVEVIASGQFERWPVRAWSSTPGLEIKPGAEKGKLSIGVAPEVPPGVYWVRLFDDEGATAPRPFLVGLLPEIPEVEPNDEPATAQRVALSGVTVNGRLAKNGDVDGFRVALKKGQTLVAALEANRRLGSPMDGVLQVASPEGFVLAQNDDDPERDPRIVFEAPGDGEFLIRAFAFPFVQESSIRFSGAPGYIYRLTLTTGGVLDHIYPLSITVGRPSKVEAVGWNIPDASRTLEVDPIDDRESVSLWHSGLANPVEVRAVETPSIVEAEPNDRAHPQSLDLPASLSGRIDRPGDVDTFSFAARKDERLLFRVESRTLGLPLDAVLRVGDASGTTIVEVDDARKTFDPEVRFTVPSDGTYRVSVRDLNGQGGPAYAYLLTLGPPRPDFALTLKADRFDLVAGKPLEVVVAVDRREGYADSIEIGLADRFDGVIASPVTSRKSGPTSSSVTLQLLGCDCVKPGPIVVVGTSSDGRRKVATASVAGLSSPIDSAWITPVKKK